MIQRKELPISSGKDYTYTPPPLKDRLVVNISIYHQTEGEQPVVVDGNHARLVDTKEQPYIRKCVVKDQWQPIDTGWLGGNVGMLVIKNDEGTFARVQPTPEERAAVAGRVVELGMEYEGQVIPFALLPPGIILPVQPSGRYLVRASKDTAKITVYAFPS